MRPIQILLTALTVFVVIAEPAMAQSVDLSPFVSFFQGIVDAFTGPLGVVIGTLALIGIFISWWVGIIDLRQALWTLAGLIGVAAAPTIAATVFGG